MTSGCIKKSPISVRKISCLYADIPFLDSHSTDYFIKVGLKMLIEKVFEMILKYRRAKAQSWP